MIEKLQTQISDSVCYPPGSFAIVEKINEIIDFLNRNEGGLATDIAPRVEDNTVNVEMVTDSKTGEKIPFVNYKDQLHKPAEWSDTNELVFQDICKHLKEEGYGGWVVLLEALRNGEFNNKQEWGEEDEAIRIEVIKLLSNPSLYEACEHLREESVDWLKTLHAKVNVNSEKVSANSEKVNVNWGEEDERIKKKLIEYFSHYSEDREWWEGITPRDIIAYLERQKVEEDGEKCPVVDYKLMGRKPAKLSVEDKQLVLKDISARVPYKVKFQNENIPTPNVATLDMTYLRMFEIREGVIFKPYLRPMSSMTEEEDKEFAMLQTDFYIDGWLYPIAAVNMVNWLNAHHFDYRGLIEKGACIGGAKRHVRSMKMKKITFSTRLSDLYGKDKYKSYIGVGKEYWYFFPEDTDIFRETHRHWNKVRITYMRSGCLFYVFPDSPNIGEEFCPVDCIMTSMFVLAELDPVKDMTELIGNIGTDVAKIMYRFDDERTVVKNWPNEKEVEIDEDELFEKFGGTVDYLIIKAFEKEE